MGNAALTRRARLVPPVAAAISTGPLTIAGGRLWRLREPSGRVYSMIRLDTRGGLRGYGEAGPVEAAEFARVLALLQGREANSFEVLGLSGPLRGAVNMAMLDLVGRATQAPVYQVLGGPTRHKARAIATVKNSNNVEAAREAGFRAFSVPLPTPLFPNSGKQYVNLVLSLWEELQKTGGEFVLDGAMRLTPGDAQMVAAALEKEHPLFLDEPCRMTQLRQVAKISEESVTPLGFGREVESLAVFQELLREQAVDVLRPSLQQWGISAIRRVSALAETYYTAVAPFHDGGPLGTAAGLQLAASLPNFFALQVPRVSAAEREARDAMLSGWNEPVKDGFFALPTGPGLGVTVDEKALGRFEVKQ